MDTLLRSLRQAARSLGRAPLFTLVAVLTLAVGIGANVTVWSVVDAILLEPLPYPEPERLVGVWHTAPGLGWDKVNQAPSLHFTYQEQSRTFEGIGMWDDTQISVTGDGEPEQVEAMRVTDGTLPLLGALPLHGRLFSAEDDAAGAAPTVILSHDYFASRFGADPSVIGRRIVLDGTPGEVIGVMRPNLDFLDEDPALYVPFRFDRSQLKFGNFSYQGIARLRPGITLEQASADVARMIPIVLDSYPMPPGFTKAMAQEVGLAPRLTPLHEEVVGDIGNVLWLIAGTVALVLLVACANIANLLLVRGEGRRQEVAVRAALGASRSRIGSQMLAESVLLAALGGACGVAFAWAAIRLLVNQAPQGLPRLAAIGIDGSVLLFAAAVTMFSAILFTLLPALRVTSLELASALKEGGRGSSDGRRRNRARNVLVTGQIAVALVLLIASGLMIRSLRSLASVHPGFEQPEDVLTMRVGIPQAEIADADAVPRAYEAMMRGIEAIPGVVAVGLASSVTMDGRDSNDPIFVEDFPPPADQIPPLRRFKWVAPGYFAAMGNRLLAGRDLSWDDIEQRRAVAVVTESFVDQFWGEPSRALGRRIRVTPDRPWREIVGVVGNVRDDGVAQPATDVVFWPMAMSDLWAEEVYVARSMVFAVRSERARSAGLLDDVRAAIWSVNRNLPLANVRTLEEILRRSLARPAFTLVMLAIAAGAAVLLGAIGIYGVTSYAVTQRRREIGVRMVFGAAPAQVSGLVLRHGLLLAMVGVAVGLASAVVLTRAMSALLVGVSPLDPVTYGLGGLAVAALVLVASYLPARRAAAVDPMETLRAEV